MIQRLRDKLLDLFSAVSSGVTRLKKKLERPEDRYPPEVIRGTSRRVIVVRPPDNRMFQEVIFILRDEFLRSPGVTKKDLLREADCAAREYTGSVLPPVSRAPSPAVSVLLIVCGSAATVAFLYFTGVI